MVIYICKRLLATIPVLLVVAVVVFSILYIAPGDPAAVIAGDHGTPEQLAEIRRQLGLDRPFHVQFMLWSGNILQGDLGVSIFSRRPVTELLLQRLEPTIALTAMSMLVSVLLAVPLGVLAAWKARSLFDRLVMLFSVLGFSVPVFVFGYVLIYVFSIRLGLLPVQGYRSLSEGVGPFLTYLILPSLTLGLAYMALIARITRASVIEVLSQDHIRTAQAKGVPTWRLLFSHALPNASVSIVTVIGVGIATLIGGAVITESVFAIPGVGRLIVDAILQRDYPVIQAVLLIFSFVYLIVNLIIDLLYAVLDPRIRY